MESLIRNARKREVIRPTRENFGYANIKIVGCGGAGNNTINRLMKIGIKGAKCVAVNTDLQHLESVESHIKLLIGKNLTRGLGAGGNPDIGRAAAEESREDLTKILREANLVFITCGEGGGTGTGSAPIVAEIAKLEGAIVVGVVTLPFDTEIGRIEKAQMGLNELKKYADTLVVIDNNRLLDIAPDLPIIEAFSVADEVLATMVKGITETISLPSLINLDFADVRTILSTGGVAIVGVGESGNKGNRVEEAIEDALNSPLLDVSIEQKKISEKMDVNNAMVIWGARVNDEYEGYLRVMLLITGIKSPQIFGKDISPVQSFSNRNISNEKIGLSNDIFNIGELAFD
ncbi:Cell division protein FtsZ [subsurface metagenome]